MSDGGWADLALFRCWVTNLVLFDLKARYSRASLINRFDSAGLNIAFRTTRQTARGRK
jgi:hypothetical protein